MSFKQDLAGARTAADIERRYNFSKRFAEVIGVAADAQKAAEDAKEAASNPAVNLTQEEIFNLLTNNGEAQGIYREDGQIYINASYIMAGVIDAAVVQVVNLVAEKVSSILDNRKMYIDGATLRLEQDGKTAAEITSEYDGYAVLRLIQKITGETWLEADGQGVYITDFSGIADDGSIVTPPKTLASLCQENGVGVLTVDRINGMAVSWEANSNGTYSLVGRD